MKKDFVWNTNEMLASVLFEPLHSACKRLGYACFPSLAELNALLDESHMVQTGKRLCFVEQGLGKLAFESQYEPRCYLTGEVQTRENNLHDLFNALVWLNFPRSKAAINVRHYQALSVASEALTTQRGSVRDMATLFDESGVMVVSADSHLSQLLCDFKWKELFLSQRDKVISQMGFYIFGHGLYEKAMQPYVGITGQGLVLQVNAEFFTWPLASRMQHLDERVATYLHDPVHCQDTHELTPVPLLGIPGWSNDNEQAEYYDNLNYFRSGRRSSTLLNTAEGRN